MIGPATKGSTRVLGLPLLVILLLIPFHTMVVAHVLPARLGGSPFALAAWKECLLLLTFSGGLVLAVSRNRLPSMTGVDVAVLLFLLYVIGSLPSSPSALAGLYGIRNYSEAFVALVLAARFVRLREPDIHRLVNVVLAVGVVVAAWGLFQSIYLGPEFLLANGYGENGQLDVSFFASGFNFQRAIGTFGSPNVFGLYVVAVLLVVSGVGRVQRARGVLWTSALAVLGAALLGSFSRSAALALVVGAAVRRLLSPPVEMIQHRSQTRRTLLAVAVAAVIVASISGYVTAVPQHIYRTVTLQDTSAVGHLQSIVDTLRLLQDHPFGVGIGRAGPRGMVYNEKLLNAESSYLIVAADIGVIGSVAYWAMWATTILALRRGQHAALAARAWTSAELCRGACAAVCAAATACVFLPLNVEVEVMLVIFLLAGAALASAREAVWAAALAGAARPRTEDDGSV